MMSRDDFEANWNRRTDGQVDRRTGPRIESLSQADALTKNDDMTAV